MRHYAVRANARRPLAYLDDQVPLADQAYPLDQVLD
jgi:hypothetical protein